MTETTCPHPLGAERRRHALTGYVGDLPGARVQDLRPRPRERSGYLSAAAWSRASTLQRTLTPTS